MLNCLTGFYSNQEDGIELGSVNEKKNKNIFYELCIVGRTFLSVWGNCLFIWMTDFSIVVLSDLVYLNKKKEDF